MGKQHEIPFIKFDGDYFRTTVRKESRYPLAWRWTKETLQNAVDAKATEISYTLDKRNKTFEIVDNGIGMSEDTILNKFLAIGGSKKSGNHVGGFGDAKKVICFCWDEWELESNKSYLSSEMLGQEPIRRNKVGRVGTRIKARLDEHFSVEQAVAYIDLCELNVKITLKVIEEDGSYSNMKLCKFVSGRELDVLDFGKLYKAKFNSRNIEKLEACVVRVNGLAMFYKKVYGLKHDMVFELDNVVSPKDSEYILNVQREGLRWREEYMLDDLLNLYHSEPRKLRDEHNDCDNIIVVGQGIGKCGSMRKLMYEKPQDEILVNVSSGEASAPAMTKDRPAPASEAQPLQSEFADVYPYDFIIKGKTSLRYTGVKYKRFCLMWHKMIQYIIFWNLIEGHDIDVGEYKIGFTFPQDDSVKAEYVELSDGTSCFLLNPDINLTNTSWRGVVMEVLDRAAHEITHKFYRYHDGNFMELYNKIKSICYLNIEDFFNLGYSIIKSSKDKLYENALMTETYEQY